MAEPMAEGAEQDPNMLLEATRAKIHELSERARAMGDHLTTDNTETDSLTLNIQNGALVHRLQKEDGRVEEFSCVSTDRTNNLNQSVYIDKIVKTPDGAEKHLQVSNNGAPPFSGSLTEGDADGRSTRPLRRLNAAQVQATIDVVLGDLSAKLDERELGSADSLDKDVADILGLPSQESPAS